MIYFNCDYTEGAHPKILESLINTNMEQTIGYGEDEYCQRAKSLIKKACDNETIDIHFLVGGTQTNLSFISSALRPHQGVISANTGHISVHETGAIEATGHKVLTINTKEDGKLLASDIEKYIENHVNDPAMEHTVQPKLVYISNSTESGAIYKKSELTQISKVCKKHGLYLYLDGARLGYALSSKENDLTLHDLTKLCDAFYIGGTKVGTLFGEALIIANDNLKEDFRYIIKQKGALLAKGRLLGLQFLSLFEDGLYKKISDHAIKMAEKISKALSDCSINLYSKQETNQIFVIMTKSLFKALENDYIFEFWGPYDDEHDIIRICTSWATTEENVDKLIHDIKMSSMTFRLAAPEDLPKLQPLIKEVVKKMEEDKIFIWDDVYPLVMMEPDIKKQRLHVLENKKDGVIAMFSLCEENGEKSQLVWADESATSLYMYRLAIHPKYTGQGLATELINKAINISKSKAADYLRLLVVEGNTPAFKLYEKLNFQAAKGFYEDKIDDRILIEYGFEIKI